MIEFLRSRSTKVYQELVKIAEQPDLLFSNDQNQRMSEARYNFFTIQKLNKLISTGRINVIELQRIMSYIEVSWTDYLSKYYQGKSFLFYFWGDYQIPALRVSIISYFDGLELPFGCALNKATDMNEVLSQYVDKAQLDRMINVEPKEAYEAEKIEPDSNYKLTVYLKKIIC
ncbi:hypothetical protein M3223_00255 [Paenibacillus pasadenensis]|uniref:hypothetical protein n=1 Tax=Paenibacillus pasadenensis TaxID=217090 RepID=UPI00203B52CF|nr:hypothetical protein [Paenibacillus pasadenensis]MCM3745773.1 hypothetical protein [Paenibacillus pasadenensis]